MPSSNDREALAVEIDRHIEQEEEILEDYHTLSDKLPQGLLSVLVNHIVTEEEMHHFLLQSLAEWLRNPAAAEQLSATTGSDLSDLIEKTKKLQRHELESIDSFSTFGARLSGTGAEPFEALLEAIVLDSQKHYGLLTLIEKTISGE